MLHSCFGAGCWIAGWGQAVNLADAAGDGLRCGTRAVATANDIKSLIPNFFQRVSPAINAFYELLDRWSREVTQFGMWHCQVICSVQSMLPLSAV